MIHREPSLGGFVMKRYGLHDDQFSRIEALLPGRPGTVGRVAQVEPKALLGDKGYDADSLLNSLEVRAIKAVIPPKSNRKVKRDCDFALYAERNLVERFFNTIKHYRGIATRYEKTARNFLAGLHLVCELVWLK